MGRGGGPQSLLDRLMRRGRKEKEEATDESDHPPRPSDEPSKEPSTDPVGDTDPASGDVITISEGAGAGGDDATVSSDDASDTGGDVLTVGDGSGASDDGSDDVVSADEGDGSADKTPPSDEPPKEPGTDPEGDPDTGDGGAATDDANVYDEGGVTGDVDDQDSGVTNNDGSGVVDDNANAATGDGTQTGDVEDGNVADGTETGDDIVGDESSGVVTGDSSGDVSDGNIADGTQTGDAIGGDENQQAIDQDGTIDTGTDEDAGGSQSIDGATEVASPIDLSLVRNARIGEPKDPSLSDDLQELKEATEPQLDPALIEARLGGKGPTPPDPDDTPDDLAFGKGATFETQLPTGAVLVNVDPEVPAEAPEGVPDDGFNDVGAELGGPGVDPVGGVPPDDGFGPHDVRIDDPGPHNEPTEVDID